LLRTTLMGAEVPLVLVVVMATNRFSMDSVAGHFVSGCERKYITTL